MCLFFISVVESAKNLHEFLFNFLNNLRIYSINFNDTVCRLLFRSRWVAFARQKEPLNDRGLGAILMMIILLNI